MQASSSSSVILAGVNSTGGRGAYRGSLVKAGMYNEQGEPSQGIYSYEERAARKALNRTLPTVESMFGPSPVWV